MRIAASRTRPVIENLRFTTPAKQQDTSKALPGAGFRARAVEEPGVFRAFRMSLRPNQASGPEVCREKAPFSVEQITAALLKAEGDFIRRRAAHAR